MSNLLRIIQQMRPKNSDEDEDEFKENASTDKDKRRERFPCLALPNDYKVRVSDICLLFWLRGSGTF